MIKIDMARELAEALNVKDKESLEIIDSLIESLREVILENDRLEIRDFGVFQIKTRKERVGRNPKNKKEYPIPAHKALTFKPGKELKDI
ncbi:MAG TPA: HU family DNA-binding protein [Candidatus Sumerlaeota bacterium]|nr:HU family DNA-binding protein [Candidatus Sumerlaeota bacterium]